MHTLPHALRSHAFACSSTHAHIHYLSQPLALPSYPPSLSHALPHSLADFTVLPSFSQGLLAYRKKVRSDLARGIDVDEVEFRCNMLHASAWNRYVSASVGLRNEAAARYVCVNPWGSGAAAAALAASESAAAPQTHTPAAPASNKFVWIISCVAKRGFLTPCESYYKSLDQGV